MAPGASRIVPPPAEMFRAMEPVSSMVRASARRFSSDRAGDDDALGHAQHVALHAAADLDPRGGDQEIAVDRPLDHHVRPRDDEVVVDALRLRQRVVAGVELDHGRRGLDRREEGAERGQDHDGEGPRGSSEPSPQPEQDVGAGGHDREDEESVDEGEEQIGPAARHDRLKERARGLSVEPDAPQPIEERRHVAGPRGRDAERPEGEPGDEQPGDVLLSRADVLGEGLLVLRDGRPEQLRLRAQGLVARAAAGAGDEVAPRRLAAVFRELAVGEPEDGQLVEVRLGVVRRHWSLARSARRARRMSTPTRFSERPRMSPISR